ncbi:glycosyltransferase family 4 protein [Sinosporangium siamense]|uniref:Undecaprenyl/decaprenyl-phosphate alpha-N-acetylglucosaminyl 1-phosphate transferase n=1 Tax=Sinosporangium siamense TaxID=1367973 RepID=A0A919RED5_9ACTN|nr:MraY family glycosyltransferase [Sinosporangium siamense]GII91265.1 hypothetical protein Ssi02_14960 [Sinosporangium siamense]
MREYLLIALAAAAVTYLLVPLVRVFAIRIGAMPEVRDRDVHTTPTPRLGGLAMYGGLVAGLIMADQLKHSGTVLDDDRAMWALIAAGGLIVVTGFLDDWWGMDALIKLGGQIGAAGLLVYFGMSLPWIPGPYGDSYTLDSILSTVVTILVVVVTINAVNFVDGLDGLAAGIVCIAGIAMWAYSIVLSQAVANGTRINLTAIITAILIGMCLGFLPHNFHPAKIFMGDTGAMLIGLVLASSIVTVTPVDPAAINRFPIVLPLLLPIAVMLLPLLDLLSAVVRRTSYGQSPFAPDRGHLHHRLLDIGHSHRRTVLIMYAWTFLFAAAVVGLSVGGVPLIVFPVTILLAVGVLVLMALPRWRLRRKNGGAHAVGRPLSAERDSEADPAAESHGVTKVTAVAAAASGGRHGTAAPIPQPMAAPVADEPARQAREAVPEDMTRPAQRPQSAGRLPDAAGRHQDGPAQRPGAARRRQAAAGRSSNPPGSAPNPAESMPNTANRPPNTAGQTPDGAGQPPRHRGRPAPEGERRIPGGERSAPGGDWPVPPGEYPGGRRAARPASGPGANPAAHPGGQPAVYPGGHPGGHPAARPGGHPTPDPLGHPGAGDPAGRSPHRPTGRPQGQPGGRPMGRPPEQSAGYGPSTGQPPARRPDHPGGQHGPGQYPAGQHPAGQHPAGQHPAGQHPAGQHPGDRRPGGQHPAEQVTPRQPSHQSPRQTPGRGSPQGARQTQSDDATGPMPRVIPETGQQPGQHPGERGSAEPVELVDDTAVFPTYGDSRPRPPRSIP